MTPPIRAPWLGGQRWADLPRDDAGAWVAAAVAAGASWVDLANTYGPSAAEADRGERLWAELGADTPLHVATKGGLVRTGTRWVPDGRAKALQQACDASRARLGVDRLDLYWLHAPNPRTKWTTTVRALAKLQRQGQVARVGLCNVRVGELRAALDLVEVAAVQVAVSPFDAAAVRSGVVEEALQRGLDVVAYRPLGAQKGARRLARHRVLGELAAARDTTPHALVLAWLWDLGLVPLPGPTRPETVHGSVEALGVSLDDEARAVLDEAFEIGPMLRTRRAERAPAPGAEREVVILVGSPGAGKTTWRRRFDGEHLSRDERGGKLAGLIPVLEERLAAGARAVALDGTYPTRAMRSRVIEAAWRHGVPVRCVWVPTDAGRCEVQVVHRMLGALGRLPMPDDLVKPTDSAIVPPRALQRFRTQLEPPEVGEGFVAVERFDVPPAAPSGAGRAVFVDADAHLGDEHREALRGWLDAGFTLVALGWRPGATDEAAAAHYGARVAALGLPVDVAWCLHAPGPTTCWCRKPLPGLAVVALRAHGLDPAACRWLATGAADRALARKLAVPLVDQDG